MSLMDVSGAAMALIDEDQADALQRFLTKYTDFIIDYIPKAERCLGWEHRLSSHSFRRAFATHNYLDSLMSQNEGLTKAVGFLKDVLITESAGEAWWF